LSSPVGHGHATMDPFPPALPGQRLRMIGTAMANQGSQLPVSATAPPAGSMFSLGWLMAQLFGPLQHRRGGGTAAHLPTVAELDADHQMELAFLELGNLLSPYPSLSIADITTAWKSSEHEGFTAAVTALHLELLKQLAGDLRQLNAYQLGRALSDTCWLPNTETGADFFLQEFNRYRLATLQTWLTQAGDALLALPAATVSRSLQSWQDWADINAATIRDTWPTAHRSVIAALRTQAGAWHAQLAGQADMGGPISLDAWIHAGQSILRTTRILMLTAFRRFWPVASNLASLGYRCGGHLATQHIVALRVDGEYCRAGLVLRPASEGFGPGVAQDLGPRVDLVRGHRSLRQVVEGRIAAVVGQPEQASNSNDPSQLRQPDEAEELPEEPAHTIPSEAGSPDGAPPGSASGRQPTGRACGGRCSRVRRCSGRAA